MDTDKTEKFRKAMIPIQAYIDKLDDFFEKGITPTDDKPFYDYYEVIYKLAGDKLEEQLYEFHKNAINHFIM